MTDTAALSPIEKLSLLDPAARELYIAEEARKHGLSPAQLKAMLARSWRFIGRPKQQAPEGDWYAWWVRAGRGFGKTLTFAQWSKEKALERKVRIALVAPTFGDVRDTMVEGETGLLSVIPNLALLGQSRSHAWNRSIGELTLANGSKFRAFSSEEPNRIRGPQHHYAWCEEISSFADAGKGDVPDSTWSNVKLSTRLGDHPQIGISSTPKTNALTRELVKMSKAGSLVMTIGSSFENRVNLSDLWWEQVVAPYIGTRLGRQEIDAEILEDVEGALWTRDRIERLRIGDNFHTIEEYRAAGMPSLTRIVVGVDPNASSSEAANSAGVIVVGAGSGTGRARKGYVLDDRTIERGGPRAWASAAVEAYHDWKADRIVAEKNNGGEMVRITLETVDANVPIELVTASRGKRTRAEPISSLYEGSAEQGNPPRVHHVGKYPELEDEQCVPGGTLVLTGRGEVAISDLMPADLIATRDGFAPLGWVAQTGHVESLIEVVYREGSVFLTPSHPVFLQGEFAPAMSARRGLSLAVELSQGNTATRSRGEASGGGEPAKVTSLMLAGSSSIERSGRHTMGQSRSDVLSITTMKTPETIRSRISFPLHRPSIARSMGQADSQHGQPRHIGSSACNRGKVAPLATSSALTAARSSSRLAFGRRSVVVAVREHVLREPIAVYNLGIAPGFLPEFFADGVLVHNCTWTPESDSPDRMDALVWGLTELLIGAGSGTYTSSVARGQLPTALDRVRPGL